MREETQEKGKPQELTRSFCGISVFVGHHAPSPPPSLHYLPASFYKLGLIVSSLSANRHNYSPSRLSEQSVRKCVNSKEVSLVKPNRENLCRLCKGRGSCQTINIYILDAYAVCKWSACKAYEQSSKPTLGMVWFKKYILNLYLLWTYV